MLQKSNEDQLLGFSIDTHHHKLWKNKAYKKGALIYHKDDPMLGLMFIKKGAIGLYGYQQDDQKTRLLNIPQGHIIGQQCINKSHYCLYDVFAEEDVETTFLHKDYFHVLKMLHPEYFNQLISKMKINLLERIHLIISQNRTKLPKYTDGMIHHLPDLKILKKKRHYKIRERLSYQRDFDIWSAKSIQSMISSSDQFEIQRSGIINFDTENKYLMILEGAVQIRLRINGQVILLDPLPHGFIFQSSIWDNDVFKVDFRVRDYANILIIDNGLVASEWFNRFFAIRQIQSMTIVINSLLQTLTRLITEHNILKRL